MNNVKEQVLVMLRLETKYGYSNTWWRVLFIDNDDTFIGKLERCHWHDYTDHKKGDDAKFELSQIKQVYNVGDQFCYSDNITICTCSGLCLDK